MNHPVVYIIPVFPSKLGACTTHLHTYKHVLSSYPDVRVMKIAFLVTLTIQQIVSDLAG